MGCLYVDRQGVELRAKPGCIAVYEQGELRQTLPLNLIERVVLSGDVRLSSGVLSRLAEAGTSVIVLGGISHRRRLILAGAPGPEAARRIRQYCGFLDANFRLKAAERIVRSKLAAQLQMLRMFRQGGEGDGRAVQNAIACIRDIRTRLKDAGAMPLTALLGQEGAAAAVYFRAIQTAFPAKLRFEKRVRRPPTDPVNACLSLGYTLLHTEAVCALWEAGLDPMIGYLHGIQHGRESLASDLVEPFRPKVDRWVWKLFRDRVLRIEHFTVGDHSCVLGKAGRGHFYRNFENLRPLIRRSARTAANLLLRWLPEIPAEAGE